MIYQLMIKITASVELSNASEVAPGNENGLAHFEICSGLRPTDLQIAHLLSLRCDEWCLSHYNRIAGVGAFISIDFLPPPIGEQIHLECKTGWPEPRTIIVERPNRKPRASTIADLPV